MKAKYSENFMRDVRFYLSGRNFFCFDGSPYKEVEYSKTGVDGIKAFHLFDSQGKLVPTKHPALLKRLIKTKGAVNLQIKQWAQGMAEKTLLPAKVSIREQEKRTGKAPEPIESLEWKIVNGEPIPVYSSEDLETRLNMPEWVAAAVFNQRLTYTYAIAE